MRKLTVATFFLITASFFNISYAIAEKGPKDIVMFRELIHVTGAEAQYDRMLNIITNQYRMGFSRALNAKLEKENKAGLTSGEMKEIEKAINLDVQNSMQALKQAFHKEIPFSEMVNNVYYPVLSKYYSPSDVKNAIKFYKSPTGKKFARLAPTIMQEVTNRINRLYGKTIQETGMRIGAELGKKIEADIQRVGRKTKKSKDTH